MYKIKKDFLSIAIDKHLIVFPRVSPKFHLIVMTQSFIDIQETQRYDEVGGGGGSHVSKIQKLQLAATQTDKMGPRMRGTFTRREEKGDDYDMSRIVDSHSFINEQLPHSFQENNCCKNLRPIQISTTKFLSVNCPLNNKKKLNRCCHLISKVHSLRKLV